MIILQHKSRTSIFELLFDRAKLLELWKCDKVLEYMLHTMLLK
jgi:hypothetical protein